MKILGFLVSAFLFYLAVRDLKLELISATLKRLDIRLLLIPVFFIMVSCAISAIKWSRIVGYGVRFKDAFVSLLIGLFVNNVLPARIGEIARAYVLSKKKPISFSYSVSTVFLDRFFDMVGLLLLTFLFFPRAGLPPKISRVLIVFVGFMLICVALLVSASRENFLTRIVEKLTRKGKPYSENVIKRISEIHRNLKRINSPSNLLYLSVLSFFQWLSMSFSLYMVIRSFDVPINPFHVPFVCAMLNMGITFPSSPGYVGLYQFLLVYLLSLFGVPKHEGFSISIIYHAAWYVPYNVFGLIFVASEQLKLKELSTLKP
ncbi:MAG: flippase-like domain-containing protein [Deltaproteobacteria bacterium]|nr:flippase-like domain-containing protein [Deltaproteobacteria bacterium]